jgi:hypothetical protein
MKRAALLALLLSGCQTADQRIAVDDRQCQSYGVAPGSPAYVQCRSSLNANRANVAASERFGTGGGLISRVQSANQ